MKPFANNPRKISAKQAARLKNTMLRYGDLSGIVHDLRTDQIVSGNQRSNIAALMKLEPTITERFDPPQEDGTVAVGYFDYQGRRFSYRAVTGWNDAELQEANLVANVAGGSWDVDLLSGINADLLSAVGFGQELLMETNELAAGLRGLLQSEDKIDPMDEWGGMPEFEQDDLLGVKSLTVHFETIADYDAFSALVGQKLTEKTKSIWYPRKEKQNLKELVAHEQS
jgi:hypothetical protein